jgi:hypothetical protein
MPSQRHSRVNRVLVRHLFDGNIGLAAFPAHDLLDIYSVWHLRAMTSWHGEEQTPNLICQTRRTLPRTTATRHFSLQFSEVFPSCHLYWITRGIPNFIVGKRNLIR